MFDYNAADFGWIPDYDGDPARPWRDNAPAIMNALNAIKADRGGRGGGTLWIDGWGTISQPIVTRHQGIHIRGTGASNPGGLGRSWFPGTQIVAPAGVTAFRLRGMTDLDAPQAGFDTSFMLRLSDMVIFCNDPATVSGHGIHVSAPVSIERCVIESFGQDGIAILADSTNGGTAGLWHVSRLHCSTFTIDVVHTHQMPVFVRIITSSMSGLLQTTRPTSLFNVSFPL